MSLLFKYGIIASQVKAVEVTDIFQEGDILFIYSIPSNLITQDNNTITIS